MGTFHKYGYLYSLSIGVKLNRTCDEMKNGIREASAQKLAKDLEEFDRDYWHAMRKFAFAKSDTPTP